ncbi:50S ribosome-binding GTPase [bacterium]|nr:50S ribosome-binding GTPase [candidate division CSSED10-310 bacterium]
MQHKTAASRLEELTTLVSDLIQSADTPEWQRYLDARSVEALQRLANTIEAYRAALLVGLVGGTGVGKSSIINLLAGSEISAASVRRPHTGSIIVYKHDATPLPRDLAGSGLPLRCLDHQVESLRHIQLMDIPDFDSYEALHRATVDAVLHHLDLILWVVDPEKYGDRLLHELITGEVNYRHTFVFIINKIDRFFKTGDEADGKARLEAVENDLLVKLAHHGLQSPLLFSMSASWTVAGYQGKGAMYNEFREFAAFVRERLNAKLCRVIKSGNLLAVFDAVIESFNNTRAISRLTSDAEELRSTAENLERSFWSEWRGGVHQAAWQRLEESPLARDVHRISALQMPGIMGLVSELINKLASIQWFQRFRSRDAGPNLLSALTRVRAVLLPERTTRLPAPPSARPQGAAIDTFLRHFEESMTAEEQRLRGEFSGTIARRHWRFTQHIPAVLFIAAAIMLSRGTSGTLSEIRNVGEWLKLIVPISGIYFLETVLWRRSYKIGQRRRWHAFLRNADVEAKRFVESEILEPCRYRAESLTTAALELSAVVDMRAEFETLRTLEHTRPALPETTQRVDENRSLPSS